MSIYKPNRKIAKPAKLKPNMDMHDKKMKVKIKMDKNKCKCESKSSTFLMNA